MTKKVEYPSLAAAVEAHRELLPGLRRALQDMRDRPQFHAMTLGLIQKLEDPTLLEAYLMPYLQPDGRIVQEIPEGVHAIPWAEATEDLIDIADEEPDPRTIAEVYRAHDVLAGLMKHEELSHQLLPPPLYVRVEAAACALCWVLHHDYNPGFADLLEDVEKRLERAGVRLVRERSES